MPKALVILAEGFEEIEGIVTIDVLRRAAVEVTVAGLTPGEIVASRKTKHIPDVVLRDVQLNDYDMVILPGGPGHKVLIASAEVKKVLHAFEEAGKYIAAICAAPNVLRKHGIIKAHDRFTIFPGVLGEESGGIHVTDRVVQSGKIITSVGPGSTFEFALHLVEVLCGSEKMSQIKGPLQLPA